MFDKDKADPRSRSRPSPRRLIGGGGRVEGRGDDARRTPRRPDYGRHNIRRRLGVKADHAGRGDEARLDEPSRREETMRTDGR